MSAESAVIQQTENQETQNEFITGKIWVPEYDNYALATTTDKGKVIVDRNEMAKAMIEKFNIVSYNETIYEYHNGVYVKSDTETRKEIRKILEWVGHAGSISAIMKDIIYNIINYDQCTDNPFNSCKDCIPVRNGVVHIDFVSGNIRLENHSPRYKFTYQLAVSYNPNADDTEIKRILQDWVGRDEMNNRRTDILLQIPAQALLQAISEHAYKKLYIIQGRRDAGKTTYIEFVSRIFGDNKHKTSAGTINVSNVSLYEMAEDKFALVDLDGKLLNADDELKSMPLHEAGKIKKIIGTRYHRMQQKNEKAYLGNIFAVHVFACNQLPDLCGKVLQDTDFFPKVEYFNFVQSFQQNDGFRARLFTEDNFSAFLNLVIKIMIKIRLIGRLLIDSDGHETMMRWKRDSNPLMQFVYENMYFANSHTVYSKDLFLMQYSEYCDDKDVDIKYRYQTKIALSKKLYETGIFANCHTTSFDAYGCAWKFRKDSKYFIPEAK